MVAKLDHNPAATHFMRNRAGSSGAREGVEYEIAWICGDLDYPLEESFWFGRCKGLNVRQKLSKMVASCLLI
jgi:hypothetical protein